MDGSPSALPGEDQSSRPADEEPRTQWMGVPNLASRTWLPPELGSRTWLGSKDVHQVQAQEDRAMRSPEDVDPGERPRTGRKDAKGRLEEDGGLGRELLGDARPASIADPVRLDERAGCGLGLGFHRSHLVDFYATGRQA